MRAILEPQCHKLSQIVVSQVFDQPLQYIHRVLADKGNLVSILFSCACLLQNVDHLKVVASSSGLNRMFEMYIRPAPN